MLAYRLLQSFAGNLSSSFYFMFKENPPVYLPPRWLLGTLKASCIGLSGGWGRGGPRRDKKRKSKWYEFKVADDVEGDSCDNLPGSSSKAIEWVLACLELRRHSVQSIKPGQRNVNALVACHWTCHDLRYCDCTRQRNTTKGFPLHCWLFEV